MLRNETGRTCHNCGYYIGPLESYLLDDMACCNSHDCYLALVAKQY
jgi:hypothetical protein